MAKVRIHNMMFYGFHGVFEYEREQGQKFYVDIEVETSDEHVGEDDVKVGVDPAAVYDVVKEVTENKRFQMLGALAAHIGDKLLAKYGHFLAVTARIRKPSVPISGPIDYVEVEVTRHQK